MAKTAVRQALAPLLEKCEVEVSKTVLEGPVASKNWTLRFGTHPGLGAMAVRRIRSELMSETSPFRNLTVRHTLGHNVNMYLNPDKSRQRTAEEVALRRLQKVAQSLHPEREWTKRRGKECVLLADCVPVARVCCPDESATGAAAMLRAHGPSLGRLNLNFGPIADRFRAAWEPQEDALGDEGWSLF